MNPNFPLLIVTDRRAFPDQLAVLARALRGAPSAAILLREKDLSARELVSLARRIRELRPSALLVSTRCDVALAAGADGVHLPADGISPAEARSLLGPSRLVGVSCHGEPDVRAALAGGADYGMFGPVFDTPQKRAFGPPLGLPALGSASRLGLPLFALGGVDLANAARCREAGARGVAAIRAVLAAPDPASAARALARP